MQTLRNEVETNRVPVSTIKSDIPIASTHMETARALKGEGVGFFKRHAMGLATHGIRHSKENAAFIPAGKRGVIVSPKEQSPLVIRHEEGHAKDYAHYGGERGWERRTSEPAVMPNRDPFIHETMAPEHRAWHNAGPLTDNEKKVRDAALETYAAGGMLRRTKSFSAREAFDSILNFNSITYHETEAEMRTRKARSNREKSSTGLAAAGMLGTGAALAATNPTIATAGRKGMSDLGGWMMSKDPARIRDASGIARSGTIGRIGTAIARNPAGAFRVAAAAPPILAAGYALAHTAASWRNDRKANDSYEKANIMRRTRNAQMQSLLAGRMRQPVAMSAREELEVIQFGRGDRAIPVLEKLGVLPKKFPSFSNGQYMRVLAQRKVSPLSWSRATDQAERDMFAQTIRKHRTAQRELSTRDQLNTILFKSIARDDLQMPDAWIWNQEGGKFGPANHGQVRAAMADPDNYAGPQIIRKVSYGGPRMRVNLKNGKKTVRDRSGAERELSARDQLNLITFGVDANGKLHNSKGEFGGDNDAVAHPTAMRMTYGKALGIAATTGTTGGIAGVSAKALVEKLKGLKRK
jgi:hypothetical protein